MVRSPLRAVLPGGVLSLLLIAAAWTGGMAKLVQPMPADTALHLRLVQPNATQALKWDPYWSGCSFAGCSTCRRPVTPAAPYLRCGDPGGSRGEFPAGAIGNRRAGYFRLCRRPGDTWHPAIRSSRYFNSLTEFSAAGIGPVYDEFHLVPFGEYIPGAT